MLSNITPLHGSFMLTSIVGFIISGLYIYEQLGQKSWGFTFMIFFAAMFVSSMISMTYGPVLPEHEKKSKQKNKSKK